MLHLWARREDARVMLSECESDAMMRATLHEAALQLGRTVETEVLGRHDLVDEEKCTGRVTGANNATASASGQAWTRAGRGRRSCTPESPGATHRSPALRPFEGPTARCGTVVCNIRRKIAACVGILRTTRQQCGAGGSAGGRATQGCRWCSKSACRRLVRLSVQRLVHKRGLGRTGLRRQRWLMVRVWRIAGSSRWRRGRTRRLTQMGWQSSCKNRLIW